MEWYLAVLRKYADFSGRARRKEYWMFALFNCIIAFALGFVDGLLHLMIPLGGSQEQGIGILGTLYSLAVLVPGIAVSVRRLHDTGRSGWWQLIALIPLVGAILLIVYLAQDSQFGDNEYGPNPKDEYAYR